MTSFGRSGWKLRMRAVEEMAADCRFLGVLDGVGSMVTGSMVGGASEVDGPSESDCAPPPVTVLPREWKTCFRGVLWICCWGDRRSLAGEAGEEGGDESCVGCRAKRAFLTVGGGVVLCCR